MPETGIQNVCKRISQGVKSDEVEAISCGYVRADLWGLIFGSLKPARFDSVLLNLVLNDAFGRA